MKKQAILTFLAASIIIAHASAKTVYQDSTVINLKNMPSCIILESDPAREIHNLFAYYSDSNAGGHHSAEVTPPNTGSFITYEYPPYSIKNGTTASIFYPGFSFYEFTAQPPGIKHSDQPTFYENIVTPDTCIFDNYESQEQTITNTGGGIRTTYTLEAVEESSNNCLLPTSDKHYNPNYSGSCYQVNVYCKNEVLPN